jgi:amidase
MSVQSPIARTLNDVVLYSKSVIDSELWFKTQNFIQSRGVRFELRQNSKFAIIWDDGFVRVTPPVRRALETTVKKLRESGHEVVEWNNKPFAKAYNSLGRLFTSDGGKSIKN